MSGIAQVTRGDRGQAEVSVGKWGQGVCKGNVYGSRGHREKEYSGQNQKHHLVQNFQVKHGTIRETISHYKFYFINYFLFNFFDNFNDFAF